MANAFNKEERVAFEEIMEGFHDALVLSRNVNIYKPESQMAERAQNTIWRPQPYIMSSVDGTAGTDISASYQDATQLSVPVTIGYTKSVPWKMTAEQLRDALQEGRLGSAAKQRLASDINVAILTAACAYGSLVVPIATAAGDFDDVAEVEAVMNEQGIAGWDRYLALNTRDYNGLAGDLAGRENLVSKKTLSAYERAYVGMIASFQTFKMDYSLSLTGNTPTVTINGAGQYYTPIALETTVVGQVNHDNRFQTIAVTVGAGTIAVGDCFTVANVYSVHHITKQSTGQLKTFRVVELVTGAGGSGTIKITPPMISNGGSTDAEAAYQNVDSTPANGAALTFLNTTTAQYNPFWQEDALELVPGHLVVPSDGTSVMRGTTDQGLEIVMQKQWDQYTNQNKYRMDCFFGVANKQPEMSGILLFGQV